MINLEHAMFKRGDFATENWNSFRLSLKRNSNLIEYIFQGFSQIKISNGYDNSKVLLLLC